MTFSVILMSAFHRLQTLARPSKLASMDDHQHREFSKEERAFLEAVAEKLPGEDVERLRLDIRIAQMTSDGGFLLVDLPGYERPDYKGHDNLPFEGKMRAADGGAM